MPKEYWLSAQEKQTIVHYFSSHCGDGYRRCAYMMIDQDVAYASPSSVYRVLKEAGMLQKKADNTSRGKGFKQPLKPHQHWHTDISYVKIEHRFYFLICVLDGYSRFIVHWDLRESMKEKDVAIVQQAALEKVPGVHPRYITDNGKQFTGKEFQKFIALHGLTHVKTSPNYPQSNGKVERFHATIKNECIRRKALLGQAHAKAVIESYIDFYNNQRLHSANGYIAPLDQLTGRDAQIHQERRKKLNQAKLERKQKYLKNESRMLTDKCVNSNFNNCTLTNYKRHPVF
ncbi:MAG: hypothetical protein MAG581_00113 [Deltaproteobacteria bacterium]|nr:hypothetical protein [Deltaproteobacteria bacterium]